MAVKLKSRREVLRMAVIGAASLAIGPLASACGAPSTTSPATDTPVPPPTATSVPAATSTPVPTLVPTVTATDISDASWNNSRSFTTKDGREISYLEAGQPDGVPVIVYTGTPGSRRLYGPWITDAQEKGIRLIGFDRPGYGNSTPLPGRSVASTAEDVTALANELGLERLMVWGISGGGPHALACAALLPELVVAAAALASLAPFDADGLDYYEGMGGEDELESRKALKGREALEQYLRERMSDASTWNADVLYASWLNINQVDAEALRDKAFANYLLFGIFGSIRNPYGRIDDGIAFVTPWGFEPREINIPVLLLHGETDPLVPIAHSRWLAEQIPNAETRFYPDDGHLSIVRHIPEVHDWLLSKWK